MEGGMETRGLTPELIEKARVELNEVPSQVPDQIRAFRETILKDPTLNFRTDDAFLLRFLRARKFDQKRALELIKNHYKQRDKNPQFFKKTTAELESTISTKMLGVLPERDRNGCPVIFLRANEWDPDQTCFEDAVAFLTLTLERLAEEQDVQINGVVGIYDMKGLTFKQIYNIKFLTFVRTRDSLINSFPLRYKALHIVNESYVFDFVALIVKPLVPGKYVNRILFHGKSPGGLQEYFSPDMLPEELGGNLESLDYSEWIRVVEAHQDTIRKNLEFGFRTS